MKKAFSLVLVFVMIVSLCACGQDETNTTTSPELETGSSTTPLIEDNTAMVKSVAVMTGARTEQAISAGNIFLIDISGSDGAFANGWSVSIAVGNDYNMNMLKYIGCCNEYLESVDIEMKCELFNSILTIKSADDSFNSDTNSDALFLALVSDGITEGDTVRFSVQSNGGSVWDEVRKIREMTGKVVYKTKVSNFTNGLSWCTLSYIDTNKDVNAIVSKDGSNLAEIRDSTYVSYGDFYNGVSLLKNSDGVLMFVDKSGEVLFSSDNPDYADQIKGIYPGGYIFLECTEANLTSSVTYYAIIDCYENFVINWTKYDDYHFFNYLGDDVFAFIDLSAFLDGFDQKDNVNTKFYNAESKIWTAVNNIDGDRLRNLPDLVAEGADGWITLQSDRKGVLISTKDGKTQTLANSDFGVIADNKVVTLKITNTNVINMIKIEEIGYVFLDNQEYRSIWLKSPIVF